MVTISSSNSGMALLFELLVTLATARNLTDDSEDLVVVNKCLDPAVAEALAPQLLVHELPAQ